MAATFNLLRGRDLIWSYVVNNYLLGEEPPPFDLLHWNSDTTNLPAGWHRNYLETLYQRQQAGRSRRDQRRRHADRPRHGRRRRPTSRPAARIISRRPRACGRSWTISPGRSASCWPDRGISPAWSTRPPRANINIGPMTSRRRRSTTFIAGATEHKGSWWPDWLEWLTAQDPKTVEATGARVPGKGKLKAIEDAPGRYVQGNIRACEGLVSGRRGLRNGANLEELAASGLVGARRISRRLAGPSGRDRPASRANRARRGHRC